ncbi:hypothetical protein [Oligoflexus tunisiensis]|uniref:hypothetical protein n=1 Tax=Oligoflexus tunisiensis TaxID=708132 RepID=UPI00114CE102|nr:hypothetical protein [Oligoflexus tunisiensis]
MEKTLSWQKLARAQGPFYVATGLWPLLHRKSFEAVTGPKKDWWLVQTVGVLVTAIGASLLAAARKERSDPETVILATGSALGLAGIDAVHVSRRTIRPVYLADMVVELFLAYAWKQAHRTTQ